MTIDDLLHDPELARSLNRTELAAAYQHAARLEADLRALLLAAPAEAPSGRPDDLLDLPAVAQLLGVPKSKVYELARRGDLPVVQIGRYARVRRADLAHWIDTRRLPLVTSRRDQSRVPAAPNAARALSGAARRRHGHHQGVGVAVGSRRAPDLGTGGPVSATPGPDAG